MQINVDKIYTILRHPGHLLVRKPTAFTFSTVAPSRSIRTEQLLMAADSPVVPAHRRDLATIPTVATRHATVVDAAVVLAVVARAAESSRIY